MHKVSHNGERILPVYRQFPAPEGQVGFIGQRACSVILLSVTGSFSFVGFCRFGGGHTVTVFQCGLPSDRQQLMAVFQGRFPGSIFRVRRSVYLLVTEK